MRFTHALNLCCIARYNVQCNCAPLINAGAYKSSLHGLLPAERGKLCLNAGYSEGLKAEVDSTALWHANSYEYAPSFLKKLCSLCRESTSQARQQTAIVAEQHVPTILPE
jgi:hypothetical protein